MTASVLPWQTREGCVIVRVRLTPKSSIEAIDGFVPTAEGTALAVRVRAVPEDGAANVALERLVARWLDVPKSAVALSHGAKSRVKSLTIRAATGAIEQKLAAKLSTLG